jgi:pimeloyl-ACP methyl ester carboxylesterase
MTGKPRRRRRRRLALGLLLAGAAVGVPVAAGALARRRAKPPQPPRWGRTRRYASRFGEIVFQQLDRVPRAPALVLLHSFGPGHDAGEWRAVAELLGARYSIYAPDLPGWGRSDGPAAGGYRPGFYEDVIEDFLRRVVREPAAVAAAGLSAAFAVRVAAQHPELMRALALVTPLGLGDGEAPAGIAGDLARTLLGVPGVRASVLDLLTRRSALIRHLQREVYAAPERVDAALVDHHYRASHRRPARAALAAFLRGDLAVSVADALPLLTTPVWIAWGRAAAAPRVEKADLWLRRLPQAGLEVFERSGSLPHAEHPGAFCRALDRFLAERKD